MNIDTYNDTDIDDGTDDEISVSDFDIDFETPTKKVVKTIAKKRFQIRERLASLCEQRFLDKQLNSLSDYWDRN